MHWLREITKAKLSQAKSFFIHIFLLKGEKRDIWAGLGRFGQDWTSLDKFGQGNKLAKWGIKAEKIRKENKNLSGS